jgi:hypothetical protein
LQRALKVLVMEIRGISVEFLLWGCGLKTGYPNGA